MVFEFSHSLPSRNDWQNFYRQETKKRSKIPSDCCTAHSDCRFMCPGVTWVKNRTLIHLSFLVPETKWKRRGASISHSIAERGWPLSSTASLIFGIPIFVLALGFSTGTLPNPFVVCVEGGTTCSWDATHWVIAKSAAKPFAVSHEKWCLMILNISDEENMTVRCFSGVLLVVVCSDMIVRRMSDQISSASFYGLVVNECIKSFQGLTNDSSRLHTCPVVIDAFRVALPGPTPSLHCRRSRPSLSVMLGIAKIPSASKKSLFVDFASDWTVLTMI